MYLLHYRRDMGIHWKRVHEQKFFRKNKFINI